MLRVASTTIVFDEAFLTHWAFRIFLQFLRSSILMRDFYFRLLAHTKRNRQNAEGFPKFHNLCSRTSSTLYWYLKLFAYAITYILQLTNGCPFSCGLVDVNRFSLLLILSVLLSLSLLSFQGSIQRSFEFCTIFWCLCSLWSLPWNCRYIVI